MRYSQVVKIIAQTKRGNPGGDWQTIPAEKLGDLFMPGTWAAWFPLRLNVHGALQCFVADDIERFKNLLGQLGVGAGKIPYAVAQNSEISQVRPRYGTRRLDNPWGWIKAR